MLPCAAFPFAKFPEIARTDVAMIFELEIVFSLPKFEGNSENEVSDNF